MAKILIVEDDRDLSSLVSDKLAAQHHLVEQAFEGKDGEERLRFYKYDLLILDWDLPQISGVEICRQFRQHGGVTPILMLTGKGATSDKEAGLDAGADDYLTKPFAMEELAARVRALLRRPVGYAPTLLSARNVELDPVAFKVMRDGKEIKLLPKEFALLEFLMRHKDQVFSAEAIIDRVWKSESDSTNESVRTTVKRLRQKIDVEGKPSLISNVFGVGYKIEAD
jgi:DNA-binding response OmpR family regulator